MRKQVVFEGSTYTQEIFAEVKQKVAVLQKLFDAPEIPKPGSLWRNKTFHRRVVMIIEPNSTTGRLLDKHYHELERNEQIGPHVRAFDGVDTYRVRLAWFYDAYTPVEVKG